MPSEIEIAWAAGLFEGEGCISVNARRRLTMTLGSTDRDVVERFAAIVGVGKIRLCPPDRHWRPHHKPFWHWWCTEAEGVAILRLIRPLLGERRGARADEAIALHEARIEKMTAERECVGCGERFRPAMSRSANRVKWCSPACKLRTEQRRRYWRLHGLREAV